MAKYRAAAIVRCSYIEGSRDAASQEVAVVAVDSMEKKPYIALRLAGIPHLTVTGEGAFPIKGYVLIALLLLSAGRRMSRQAIAALLWDDAPEEKALTNLRQLLARIHRMWPYAEPLVETNGPHLMAGPGSERCDLAVILRQSKSKVLAEQVETVLLAKGELLDTIDTGGSELSQWFRAERERFRRMVLTLAGDTLVEMTRFGRASERDLDRIGESMLALEPEREESYRMLIEAYGRNGNFQAVDRLYTALVDMLRREFDTEPRPQTVATMRRILASAPQSRVQVIEERHRINAGKAVKDDMAGFKSFGLTRVALFPPRPVPGTDLHPLHRSLIEDVANDLSRHRTFAVLAPYSSFRAAEEGNPDQLSALRSAYFITGFIVPGSEYLALRLTRQPDNEIVWAAEYLVSTERLAVSFRLITRQIAATLASEIERDQLDRSRPDPKPTAYCHYLEGQARLQSFDLARLRRARSDFKRATEEDGQFAPSHARIAQTLQLEWVMLGGTDPSLLNQARSEADLAMKIDPGNGAGHWMSAVVALYQRDFDYTAEKFADAEALNPHSADLLIHHADALSHLGRADEGWERFERALELNPLPPDYYWWAGATIAIRRRCFEEAIQFCAKMANDESAIRALAISHGFLGQKTLARQYGRRVMENYPGLTALDLARMAPDRRPEDIEQSAQGLRLAGLP
ncbi:BTAD domain-containing putative transcriptional regulator [Labrys neptuniae]